MSGSYLLISPGALATGALRFPRPSPQAPRRGPGGPTRPGPRPAVQPGDLLFHLGPRPGIFPARVIIHFPAAALRRIARRGGRRRRSGRRRPDPPFRVP